MNILVTGGTGFVGEHFIPLLLKDGHYVRLLVRNIEKGKELFGDSCEYFKGDITDSKSLIGACNSIDIVFHMAGKAGNELPSEENFEAFRRVNVSGTRNIVEECKKHGVKRFVYVSSIAAMGIVKQCPITEKSKCDPYLPYQVSRHEAEQYLLSQYRDTGFPIIIIRPTKIYGIGEHVPSYLTLVNLCKKGIWFKVGKGKNYTSNVYITDLAFGLAQCVDNGRLGEIYILTSDDSIEFSRVGQIISRKIGRKIHTIPMPTALMVSCAGFVEWVMTKLHKRPIVTKRNIEATVNDRVYSIDKAQSELGYSPKVKMADGIERVIGWYIEKGIA